MCITDEHRLHTCFERLHKIMYVSMFHDLEKQEKPCCHAVFMSAFTITLHTWIKHVIRVINNSVYQSPAYTKHRIYRTIPSIHKHTLEKYP